VAGVWLLRGDPLHIDVWRVRQIDNTFGFVHFQAQQMRIWFNAHTNLIAILAMEYATEYLPQMRRRP
jgi:hypothetical protein